MIVKTRLATHPDAYDIDLLCVQLLIHHRLADPTWLGHWLAFKRERWTARNELLLTIEQEFKSAQQGVRGNSGDRAKDGELPEASQDLYCRCSSLSPVRTSKSE